jgi:DNA repair exonuclease SbcCD ATPase subunit
LKYYLSKI